MTLGHVPIRRMGEPVPWQGKWGVVMTLRATLLSLATLFGITLWGMAVYSDGAVAGNAPLDGYGVSAISIDAS